MKVLFTALHFGYFRNFESVIRELAARGHEVRLAVDEPEDSMNGQGLAERLAAECPGVTWGFLPALDDEVPWFDTARRLRLGLDYARMLDPRYRPFPKLRMRTAQRSPRVVRWLADHAPGFTRAALMRIERWLPPAAALVRVLRNERPDVIILATLTYSRSQQMDMLKAARVARVPVAAAVTSWDHLSSKALLHVAPDRVLVWNDVQKQEAVEMHGLPAERVVVTGAQCYDQWFTRDPHRDRAAFCHSLGLRSDRPFVLWVQSALTPKPEPPEPHVVIEWLKALRTSSDPRLRELGVVVRPHPERIKDWLGYDVTQFDNVAFAGRNPIDPEAKHDYFDALFHSGAVVGILTSAFLEAAIVGRPVLTLTLPELAVHQDGMRHFQYLRTVAGGLLHVAADLGAHLAQLSTVLAQPPEREERNRRFLEAFIRPGGLDTPATPVFVDAINELVREGTHPDPSLDVSRLAQRLVVAAASHTDGRFARYLLNDARDDQQQDHRAGEDERRRSRELAKVSRQRAKRLRNVRHRAIAGVRLVGRTTLSGLRSGRYHAAMGVHRVLAAVGIEREQGR